MVHSYSNGRVRPFNMATLNWQPWGGNWVRSVWSESVVYSPNRPKKVQNPFTYSKRKYGISGFVTLRNTTKRQNCSVLPCVMGKRGYKTFVQNLVLRPGRDRDEWDDWAARQGDSVDDRIIPNRCPPCRSKWYDLWSGASRDPPRRDAWLPSPRCENLRSAWHGFSITAVKQSHINRALIFCVQ